MKRPRKLKALFHLFLFLVLAFPSSAQSLLQGEWRSSDGGRLIVGETGPAGTFPIGVYSPDGKHHHKRVGRWDQEGENRFRYQIGDEEVCGTYFPEDRRLELRDNAGTWTSLWRRSPE